MITVSAILSKSWKSFHLTISKEQKMLNSLQNQLENKKIDPGYWSVERIVNRWPNSLNVSESIFLVVQPNKNIGRPICFW